MSCYFLAQITINDPTLYQRYLDGFDEIFKHYDARVIAVEDNPEILEGNWPGSRIVIIRFKDRAEALRWYNSGDYSQLREFRIAASVADVVLIEGRD